MRSVHMLLCRLVRSQAVLPPPLLPVAQQLSVVGCCPAARGLSRFGDPDTFGDLSAPAEGAEEQIPPHRRHAHRRPGEQGGHGEQSEYGDRGDWREERGRPYPRAVGGESGKPAGRGALHDSVWNETRVPSGGDLSNFSVKKGGQSSGGGSPPARQKSPAVRRSEWTHETRAGRPAAGLTDDSDTPPRALNPSSASGGVIDWDLEPDDADDVAAEGRQRVISQIPKLNITCHSYGRKFKRMIKNGKLGEALELFQNQMLQVDKVQPDTYCYSILISGCAQAGYTKMAFKLYADMRRRRLKVKHATYTSLLNACANGPSPTDGLRRIQRLTAAMAERGYMMNVINYQALIKAYGRCGELRRAFETADELLRLGHPMTAELACFLLQACVSDREQGFRHALLVWRQVRFKQVAPTIFLYNLLLRSALDCGAGDTAIFEQAMELIVSGSAPGSALVGSGAQVAPAAPAIAKSDTSRASCPSASPGSEDSTGSERAESTRLSGRERVASPSSVSRMADSLRTAGALEAVGPAAAGLPDLLSRQPSRGGLVQLRHLDTPPARLGLLGGWTGALKTMASDNISPDIKTFSLLLNAMPHEREQEESLIRTMDAIGVVPDVGFFNQLMKKRASRRHPDEVKAVFTEMQRRGVRPDVASFGCLAMSVRSWDAQVQFMDTLKELDVRPNVEVLSTLLNGALRVVDVPRALAVMEAFVAHQVRPDRRALERLEELRLRLRTLSIDRERGRPVPPAARRNAFPDWVRKFNLRYAGWLADVEAEPETHPHRQYDVPPLEETTAAAETGRQGVAPEGSEEAGRHGAPRTPAAR